MSIAPGKIEFKQPSKRHILFDNLRQGVPPLNPLDLKIEDLDELLKHDYPNTKQRRIAVYDLLKRIRGITPLNPLEYKKLWKALISHIPGGTPLEPPLRKKLEGSRGRLDRFDGVEDDDDVKFTDWNKFFKWDWVNEIKTRKKLTQEFKLAMKKTHDQAQWRNNIINELQQLGKTPTGATILELIYKLWQPKEITITNRDPITLSANTWTNIINIPSLPRLVCYKGETPLNPPYNGLGLEVKNKTEQVLKGVPFSPSRLWMVLGHELLHLIHMRLGIHYHDDPAKEEENTVQGIIDEQEYIDKAVVKIKGKSWHLTENQFRKESKQELRNGYGSIPLCTLNNQRNCHLLNQYGSERACRMGSNTP